MRPTSIGGCTVAGKAILDGRDTDRANPRRTGLPDVPAQRKAGSLMSEWIHIASVIDCPAGSAVELVVEGSVVALFHVDGRFYVTDGVCPHQGGPLGKGALSGCIVTCPWHGWQFDIRTGQSSLSPNTRQQTYPVKVQGNDILVQFPADD